MHVVVVGDIIIVYGTNTICVLMHSYGRTDVFVCVCVCVTKDVWTRALFYTSTVEIECNCCCVERDSGLQQG